MSIQIHLDKIEFYKEDYVDTGKVYLAGSITGLNPSKQYCVWWTCDMCPTGMYLHANESMDYFFIDKVSSISLGNSAHLHTDDIIWSPGDYSLLGVYIIEVDGVCENYISSILASTSLIVYHDYETPPQENGRIYCSSFPTGANIYLNGTHYGTTNMVVRDLDPGEYDLKFTLDGYEDYTKTVVVEAGYETFISKNLIPLQQDIPTSLGIVIYPSRIGVGQKSAITGHLVIADVAYILPGIPVKLYLNKGQGFTYIATSNTPANGLGQFEYYYEAISSDADKTLEFKWVYEGGHEVIVDGENVPLASSESDVLPLIIETEVVLEETVIELLASPSTDVTPTEIVQLTAYLIDYFGNPLQNGSFVNFYKGNTLIVTSGTVDGYAYCNYTSVVEDSEQTLTFSAEYLGIENVYAPSEDTVNVLFEEHIQPEIGEIGAVTYEMIKQVGNDEITFYISVTNLTDEEQCFYINLMDPENETEVLEKAPNIPVLLRIADRIPAGDTEVIELSSTWDLRWNINNVIGQIVTFELRHSEPILDALGVVVCNPLKSAYDVVHKVSVDLTNIDIIVSVCADNTEGLITKDLQIGLMYSDPTTVTKTDVCMSPMNVINIANEEFCTSWHRPGPFTCSGTAYLADSMFVAYARGFDDEDNEYYEYSSIFRSVYGTKQVSLKVTDDSLVDDECYIWSPVDPTKCLLTDNQAKFLMYGGIFALSLYGLHVFKPVIHGAGETLKELKK